MVRAASEGEDEREEDDAHDGYNLEAGQPELELAEESDAEVIYADYGNQEYRNEHSWVDAVTWYPVLNNKRSGRELVGRDDDILEPVGPSEGEAQAWIAEARRVSREAGAHGKPGRHLAEGGHDEEDDEADDGIGEKDGCGAGLGQGLARADDETGSDGAADRNHGDVPGLQPSLQRRLGRRLKPPDVQVHRLDDHGRRLLLVVVLLAVRGRRSAAGGHC